MGYDTKSDYGDLKDDEDGAPGTGNVSTVQGSSGNTPDKVAVGGAETESAKKRRRINPTPLGDIGPVAVSEAFRVGESTAPLPAPVSALASPGVSTISAASVLTSVDSNNVGNAAVPPKKVKKRIAPMLVPPPAP